MFDWCKFPGSFTPIEESEGVGVQEKSLGAQLAERWVQFMLGVETK